jgi:hypothetical protein
LKKNTLPFTFGSCQYKAQTIWATKGRKVLSPENIFFTQADQCKLAAKLYARFTIIKQFSAWWADFT